MEAKHTRWIADNRGFSLIELMVVVIILGILAMYIGPKLMGRTEQAKIYIRALIAKLLMDG